MLTFIIAESVVFMNDFDPPNQHNIVLPYHHRYI